VVCIQILPGTSVNKPPWVSTAGNSSPIHRRLFEWLP
jgi:hypothetical protein